MKTNFSLNLILAFLLFHSTNLLAQTQSKWNKSRVVKISQQVSNLVNNNQFDEAIATLDKNIAELSANAKLNSYQSYFQFNKAYLYHNKKGGDKQSNLKSALTAYEKALALQPGDLKILKNLVLVSQQLGDSRRLVKYCKQAAKVDKSPDRGKWYTILGDHYKNDPNHKDWDRAYAYYERGLSLGSGNREAALKLVTLYQKSTPEYLDQYFAVCKKMDEVGFSETAMEGFIKVFQLACENKVEVQEEMIFYWASILAKNNWVRPRLVKELAPMTCSLGPVDEIKNKIANGWSPKMPANSWWKLNNNRRFYYYALQKSWADFNFSRGKKKLATRLYEDCNDNVGSTDLSLEVYGKKGLFNLEVITQLARLYNEKEIDPLGKKFSKLERSLFDTKGGAYRVGDLENIQKLHTILGLIYVDRKQWDSGVARNAEFQLSNAISTADKRAQANPKDYSALPHLHKLLGQTYSEIGKPEKAAESYLNAAVAYMEKDNLKLSAKMINTADSHIKPETNKQIIAKRKDVNGLFTIRNEAGRLNKNNFNASDNDYFKRTMDVKELDNYKTIDPQILKRQQYKILNQMGNKAIELGEKQEGNLLLKEADKKYNQIILPTKQGNLIRKDKSNTNLKIRQQNNIQRAPQLIEQKKN